MELEMANLFTIDEVTEALNNSVSHLMEHATYN